MSNAGWYPDPGGASGMLRYWDGSQWTASLSPDPNTPQYPGVGQPGVGPAAFGGGADPGQPFARPASSTPGAAPRSSRGIGWWILILVLVIGLIFGGYTALRSIGFGPFGSGGGNSNPALDPCPAMTPDPSLIPQITADGRVQGGRLSYPMLGDPWGPPQIETRVAFAQEAFTQNVVVEPDYQAGHSWVASVLVAELVAGDGFFSPQDGTELVATCAMGSFYGDASLQRQDVLSQAVTIDGYDGWVLETHLSFDIKGLNETGETAIFLVVATDAASSSLYYASIPDSRPDLLTTARQVQAQLQVEP